MKTIKNDLIRKINLQRSIHSYYERTTKHKALIFRSISIIAPAIVTFIAFSDFSFLKEFIPELSENHIKLTIGIIAFIIFLNSVFDEIFKISEKHKKHRNAIEQYSQLLRDIKLTIAQNPEINDHDSKIEMYNQRYIQLSANTIPFTDKQFNKAELEMLKCRAIRETIKKEPFLRFWEIKKKAQKWHKNNSVQCCEFENKQEENV